MLDEGGGHRWQRVPPTERNGRVHTSTVTVAVLRTDNAERCDSFDLNQVEIFTTRGSGPGGQHRNTTDSVVTARHKPTGIEARAAAKSQHENRKTALRVLTARVLLAATTLSEHRQNQSRSEQIGSGMRGDKIRTYRMQDDRVTDHRTSKKARLSDIQQGKLEKLYE